MKRIHSLITMVAVLYALSAPLCALACIHGTASESATTEAAVPSCHEAPATPADSETDRAPSSHANCECDALDEAIKGDDGESKRNLAGISVLPTRFELRALPTLSWVRPAMVDVALPPPNILLLHSTLLL